MIDGRGNTTRFDYDAFGRIVHTVQVVDRPVGILDPRPLAQREGHVRFVTYDKLDNVTVDRFFEWRSERTYALLSRTTTGYDERGRRMKVVCDLFDSPVLVTVATLGEQGLPDLDPVVPAGETSIETWLILDRNGRVTERREGVIVAGPAATPGSSSSWEYDFAGRQTSSRTRILRSGLSPTDVTRTDTQYDLNGNPVRTDRTDWEHDAGGTIVDTEVISIAAEFDAFNRRTAVIDGMGNRTVYRFDSRDAIVSRTDPLQNVTNSFYDRYGRLIQTDEVVDAANTITTVRDLNDDGLVNSLLRGDSTNPPSAVVAYEYDAVLRRTATTLAPNAGPAFTRRSIIEYDAVGNVVTRRQASGLIEAIQYDALNRVVRSNFDRTLVPAANPIFGAQFEEFTYDGVGRLVGSRVQDVVSGSVLSTAITVDSFGRPTAEVQSATGLMDLIVQREFDSRGNRISVTLPSGRTLAFAYDLANRLLHIRDTKRGTPNVGQPGNDVRTVLKRRYIGMRWRGNNYGNNTSSVFAYDRSARLIGTHHRDSAGASLVNFLHLYDSSGNRRQDWQAGSQAIIPSQVYQYDGLNRLLKRSTNGAAVPDLAAFKPPSTAQSILAGQSNMDSLTSVGGAIQHSYSYDAGGNCLSQTAGGTTTASPTDILDQLTASIYDSDGNPRSDGAKTFGYDHRNRLVSVAGAPSVFGATYDAVGRRVLLQDGDNYCRFAYDTVSEIAEYRDTSLYSEHVLAAPPDDRTQLYVDKADYSLQRDQVGTIRLVTDSAGAVVGRFEFDPFGIVVAGGMEFSACRHRFMGREWDGGIEAYHFRSRHYFPELNRFGQRDPKELASARSSYQAFFANPLVFIDPMGTNATHAGDGSKKPIGQTATGIDVVQTPFDAAEFLRRVRELSDQPSSSNSTLTFRDPAEYLVNAVKTLPADLLLLVQPQLLGDEHGIGTLNAIRDHLRGYKYKVPGEQALESLYGVALTSLLAAPLEMLGSARALEAVAPISKELSIASSSLYPWEGTGILTSRAAALRAQVAETGTAAFNRGGLSLEEIGSIASSLQREIAVTRIDQTRFLRSLGTYGGELPLSPGEQLIGHVHPGTEFWGLERQSLGSDFQSMSAAGIYGQAVINESGYWRLIFSSGGVSNIFLPLK